MPIAYGGDNITFADGSKTTSAYTGFKNRIINGGMVFDQRNAGASVTITGTNASDYVLDRWFARANSATGSKISVQRSTVAPSGFSNSQLVTSLSAYTIGATEHFGVMQHIEGFNVADLAWGTANAKTITISFKVRSSLTGTFGGFITNYAGDRFYVFSYTINSANTFEDKTITIPGDTTGTWNTDNNVGLTLSFSVAAGSSVTGAAGSWGSTLLRSVTGQTSLVGTNGATFYITGVQLEVGSSASTFDYRPYGTELQLCQRYYYNHVRGNGVTFGLAAYYSSTYITSYVQFPVTMRTTPSGVIASGADYYVFYRNSATDLINSLIYAGGSAQGGELYNNSDASGTAGQSGFLYSNNNSSSIAFSAEL